MISLNWLHKSVDHKTLCLSFFTRPLLGIPQRYISGFVYYYVILDRLSQRNRASVIWSAMLVDQIAVFMLGAPPGEADDLAIV